ncbi:MAG: hypothetical protein KQI35_18055 [Bacteroidetes bacterium]|nr:hypothetical protein [Bacteroidota bacterium]
MKILKSIEYFFNRSFHPGDYLFKNGFKYEVPLSIIVVISIILTHSQTIHLETLFTLTLAFISIMYYFMAFGKSGLGNPPSAYALFIRKLLYIALCISTLAVLFYLNQFNGFDVMIRVSLVVLAACLLSYFFIRFRVPDVTLLSATDTRRLLIFIVADLLVAVDILDIAGG